MRDTATYSHLGIGRSSTSTSTRLRYMYSYGHDNKSGTRTHIPHGPWPWAMGCADAGLGGGSLSRRLPVPRLACASRARESAGPISNIVGKRQEGGISPIAASPLRRSSVGAAWCRRGSQVRGSLGRSDSHGRCPCRRRKQPRRPSRRFTRGATESKFFLPDAEGVHGWGATSNRASRTG